MEENENTQEESEEVKDNTLETAIEEIKSLKENTVSKDEYNTLLEENRKLIKSLTEERKPDTHVDTEEEIMKRIRERSNKLVDGDLTGYEYAKILIDNDDDMQKLGMDPYADNQELKRDMDLVRSELKKALKDSEKEPILFSSIMNARYPETPSRK